MEEFFKVLGEVLKQYGLGGASLIFAFYVVHRSMNSMETKEKSFTETNTKFINTINKISDDHKMSMNELHNTIERRNAEAKEFQEHVRREHEKSLENHVAFGKQMEQVCDALGRINGYRDEH